MTKKSIIAKKSLFIKSHHKSTRNGARPLNTCTHHILDKRNSKPLEWGTSGQTGNSWFFDFWGENLEIFGGKLIFFPSQKVVHYWYPTKSLIMTDPQKPLLPLFWASPHIPEVKSHHFRKSQVKQTYLFLLVFAGSPTLVISGVPLLCFV